jgi:hypothetical protein
MICETQAEFDTQQVYQLNLRTFHPKRVLLPKLQLRVEVDYTESLLCHLGLPKAPLPVCTEDIALSKKEDRSCVNWKSS